ncbi:MAG: PQ-loop domain-containing transporter [Nitrosotalea sp.]
MHFLGFKHKIERRLKEALGKQSVPAKSSPRYVHFLDRITFFAGVVGPFTVLPQVYEIFSTKNASGVSLTSWIMMFVVTLPWIFYGMAHKEKSIVVSFILWEVVNLFVIAGILMYS